MTRWIKKCMEFEGVRQAIDDGNNPLILRQLIAICDKYAKQNWDFAEDYEKLRDDISEMDIEEADDDEINFTLDEFYDLCDNARVWLGV